MLINDNNANVISATTELDETISFGGAVDDITINTIKNRGGSFEVDAKGNLVATSVVSNGDVRSDKYSLNTIGANTAGITSTGGSTTIQGVSFANGRMQATQAKIGGVEIKDGHVDGVKIGQLRDAVANNIVNTEGLTKNVDRIKTKNS